MFRGKPVNLGASSRRIGAAASPNSSSDASPAATPLRRVLQRAASSSRLMLTRNKSDFDELASVDSFEDSRCSNQPKRGGKKKSIQEKSDNKTIGHEEKSGERQEHELPSLLTSTKDKPQRRKLSSGEKSTEEIVNRLLDDGEDSSELFDKKSNKLLNGDLSRVTNHREEPKESSTLMSPRRRQREKVEASTTAQVLKQTASVHIMSPRRRSMNVTDHSATPSRLSRSASSRCGQTLGIPSVPLLVDSPLDSPRKNVTKHSVLKESFASPGGKSSRRQSSTTTTMEESSSHTNNEHASPRRRPSLSRTSSVEVTSTHTTPRRLSLTGVSLTASTGHISPRRQSSSRRLLMQVRRNSKSKLMTSDESTLGDAMSFAMDDASALATPSPRRMSITSVSTSIDTSSSNALPRRLSLTGTPLKDTNTKDVDSRSTPRRQSSQRRLSINGKRKSKSNLMSGNDDSPDGSGKSSETDSTTSGRRKGLDVTESAATSPIKPRRLSLTGAPLNSEAYGSSPSRQPSSRRIVRRNSKSKLSMSEDSKNAEAIAGDSSENKSPTSPRRQSVTTGPAVDATSCHGAIRRLSLTGTPLVASESVPSTPRRQSSNRYLVEKSQQNSSGKLPTTKIDDGSASGTSTDLSIDLSIDLSLNASSKNTPGPENEKESPKKTSFIRTLARQASRTGLMIRQASKSRLTLSKRKSSSKVSCEDDDNEHQHSAPSNQVSRAEHLIRQASITRLSLSKRKSSSKLSREEEDDDKHSVPSKSHASRAGLLIRQMSKTRLTLINRRKSSSKLSTEDDDDEQHSEPSKNLIGSNASVVSDNSRKSRSCKTTGPNDTVSPRR
mmetsp:Transcript_9430/g.18036  ORF Transcript_9430/g.18036 Transcript_9430/m.18036 type:complete len:837 (-) Transcript_9430:385-2895(-)|eukprot:scaffold5479_cov199-Amphora_coffeaeformis.AAC.77